jgi:hypothetical protein
MDEFLEGILYELDQHDWVCRIDKQNPHPEKYLHPDDWELFKWACSLINLLCKQLDVHDIEVEPKRRPLSDKSGVVFYGEDRKISIAMRYKERASDGGRWCDTPRHKDYIRKDILWIVPIIINPSRPTARKIREELVRWLGEKG